MANKNSKKKCEKFYIPAVNFGIYVLIFMFLCGFCGCAVVEFIRPDKPPYYTQLWGTYEQTKLRESTAADVLSTIHLPEYELLSQSKSIVASLGQKKKTYHTWLNMVAFDENELTAKRKYFLFINEKPKLLFVEPREGVTFDSEMILGPDVLYEPYANENARRIAILRQISADVRKDTSELGSDNKTVAVCGMLIAQGLEAVLVQLDSSPVQAGKLSEQGGLEFSHMTFTTGKIQMVIEDDIVTVKMMLGSFVRYFQKRPGGQEQEDIKQK
jgi:hypothetical protein